MARFGVPATSHERVAVDRLRVPLALRRRRASGVVRKLAVDSSSPLMRLSRTASTAHHLGGRNAPQLMHSHSRGWRKMDCYATLHTDGTVVRAATKGAEEICIEQVPQS